MFYLRGREREREGKGGEKGRILHQLSNCGLESLDIKLNLVFGVKPPFTVLIFSSGKFPFFNLFFLTLIQSEGRQKKKGKYPMISLRSGTSWHMSLTSTTVFTEQVLGFPCQLNAVVPFQGMEPNKDGVIASRGSFSRSRLRISARNLKMPLLTHGPTWFSERINLPVSTRRKQCACLRLELMSLNLWLTAFLFCSLVKIRKSIYEP